MKKLLNKKRVEFLESLEDLRGYSDLTIKTYDEAISEALRFVELIEENEHLFINLMPYRLEIANLKAKTISKKLSAFRSFVTYLNDNNILVTLKSDSSIKVAKTLPKPISHKHILEALELCNEEENLVVIMLYTLGLRISELSTLKIENISDKWIRVLGKGNKDRDIPLLSSTKFYIDEYLDTHEVKTFLFEKKGEKLSENSLRYIVNKVFSRVAMKVTPHQLRHSYATEMLNNSARISDISELLGHSSMATTQIYTKLGTALKQKSYNKAHPLCHGS